MRKESEKSSLAPWLVFHSEIKSYQTKITELTSRIRETQGADSSRIREERKSIKKEYN